MPDEFYLTSGNCSAPTAAALKEKLAAEVLLQVGIIIISSRCSLTTIASSLDLALLAVAAAGAVFRAAAALRYAA
jgi:hypothetical protein